MHDQDYLSRTRRLIKIDKFLKNYDTALSLQNDKDLERLNKELLDSGYWDMQYLRDLINEMIEGG